MVRPSLITRITKHSNYHSEHAHPYSIRDDKKKKMRIGIELASPCKSYKARRRRPDSVLQQLLQRGEVEQLVQALVEPCLAGGLDHRGFEVGPADHHEAHLRRGELRAQ